MNGQSLSFVELMGLHNGEFVDQAYDAILGRDPDDAGRAYYVARLRAGYSKLSVLSQLRGSEEALVLPAVPGIDGAVRRYRLGRLPLIGWFFRKLYRVESESVNERLQRAILSELASLQSESFAPAVAAPRPQSASPTSFSNAPARRNLAAEQLSPRAREIFDKLVSG